MGAISPRLTKFKNGWKKRQILSPYYFFLWGCSQKCSFDPLRLLASCLLQVALILCYLDVFWKLAQGEIGTKWNKSDFFFYIYTLVGNLDLVFKNQLYHKVNAQMFRINIFIKKNSSKIWHKNSAQCEFFWKYISRTKCEMHKAKPHKVRATCIRLPGLEIKVCQHKVPWHDFLVLLSKIYHGKLF